MSDFDALLAEYTARENLRVHGVICKCVERDEIYSKTAGHTSLSPAATPLNDDVVLRLASATKLITSIALLQCVELGLIGLDESLTTTLPEFENVQVLTAASNGEFTYQPAHTPITPRHLLSHTSGLAYRFTNPLLGAWADALDEKNGGPSLRVTEWYNIPLVFNPGTGWIYGCGLDWAGIVISRLHGGIELGEYFVQNIWRPLDLQVPFPRFNIASHATYLARAMGGVSRLADGSLVPNDTWAFDNPVDQDGGAGLAGMLGWGGASNIIWWVSREVKVAGFFATKQVPFGNEAVARLVNEWKRDFWRQFHAGR